MASAGAVFLALGCGHRTCAVAVAKINIAMREHRRQDRMRDARLGACALQLRVWQDKRLEALETGYAA